MGTNLHRPAACCPLLHAAFWYLKMSGFACGAHNHLGADRCSHSCYLGGVHKARRKQTTQTYQLLHHSAVCETDAVLLIWGTGCTTFWSETSVTAYVSVLITKGN